jgi:4-hydroxybenzoate polyprenyltransferase
MMSQIKYIFMAMRPKQWVKNVFIFAGLIFSRNLFDASLLTKVFLGFILFCLGASSVYIFNDICDIEKDKEHPEKCKRPLAAGHINLTKAYLASTTFAATALIGAFFLDLRFFVILTVYVGMNIAYSVKLKHIVILDVMCIAFGFVFRVLAGTALAGVQASDWLIICTITISLFLGFSKRRHELTLVGANAENHRKVLSDYSIVFLDQMIAVATACSVMSYALYTIADETIARFSTRNLVFTIPFVIYGIYRYLYLLYQKQIGGNPTSALLTDFPLLLNGLLWVGAIILIIYF